MSQLPSAAVVVPAMFLSSPMDYHFFSYQKSADSLPNLTCHPCSSIGTIAKYVSYDYIGTMLSKKRLQRNQR